MSQRRVRPWELVPAGTPVCNATLREWRDRARREARRLGYPGACELCHRPVRYRRGYVALGKAKHPSRPQQLKLCAPCIELVRDCLYQLQIQVRSDGMPLDA